MFIHRPNAELHVLSFGQGPLTLLALAGWVASGEIWLDVFGHLPHWRCVAIDHRGSGSSMHSGPITLEMMTDDVLAVADELGLHACVLAAESSGAAVALRAVQQAPSRFLGQVLVAPAWQRPETGTHDGLIAQLQRDYPGTLRGFVHHCLPEAPSPELRRRGLQMLLRTDVAEAVELLRSQSEVPPDDSVPPLNLPTLLLHGTDDHIVPLCTARQLATQLPQCELHELPGLGHAPIITAPREVAALINAFGQRLTPADTAAQLMT
jgi:pimeloyl-ACP methyl ester carboxylesterase